MKRLLGPCLAVLVLFLAGCGDESSGADDPAPTTSPSSPSSSPLPTNGDSLAPQTIAIVFETAAGGKVDLNARPVEDELERNSFTAQFQRGGM